MRTCTICGTKTAEFCPNCLAAFEQRPAVVSMTVDQKAAELRLRLGILEIPFDMVHRRTEELMGRDVWTHELGNVARLVEELERGRPATMQEIVDLIPAEKRIVIEVAPEQPRN